MAYTLHIRNDVDLVTSRMWKVRDARESGIGLTEASASVVSVNLEKPCDVRRCGSNKHGRLFDNSVSHKP